MDRIPPITKDEVRSQLYEALKTSLESSENITFHTLLLEILIDIRDELSALRENRR